MKVHGGMVVVGLSTGDVFIEDIQVVVPHKVAVYIPADKALRSKDLYRVLGQQRVFKLDGGTGVSFDSGQPDDRDARILELEQENSNLRAQLEIVKTSSMQQILGKIQELQAGIGRLETLTVDNPPSLVRVPTVLAHGPVGGDAPTFLPSEIKPKDAEAQIRIDKQVSEGSSLDEAGSKLKELRRKAGS
jgi:hypothetical protein